MVRRQGIRTRASVLAILEREGTAMGAYEVLARLREPGGRVAPPTVYRALAALVAEGRVHRVESANAYIACRHGADEEGDARDRKHDHGHGDDAPVLSICDDCGTVGEHAAPAIVEGLVTTLAGTGFAARRPVIEVHGRCATCHGAASSDAI